MRDATCTKRIRLESRWGAVRGVLDERDARGGHAIARDDLGRRIEGALKRREKAEQYLFKARAYRPRARGLAAGRLPLLPMFPTRLWRSGFAAQASSASVVRRAVHRSCNGWHGCMGVQGGAKHAASPLLHRYALRCTRLRP